MDARLNNLLQFSELTKALEFLYASRLDQEKKITQLERDSKSKSDELRSLQFQVELLIAEKTRMASGMLEIPEINKKLESWSSRFTDIEGKFFEVNEKVEKLTEIVENELERLRTDQSRSATSFGKNLNDFEKMYHSCLLYTSPSPRDS